MGGVHTLRELSARCNFVFHKWKNCSMDFFLYYFLFIVVKNQLKRNYLSTSVGKVSSCGWQTSGVNSGFMTASQWWDTVASRSLSPGLRGQPWCVEQSRHLLSGLGTSLLRPRDPARPNLSLLHPSDPRLLLSGSKMVLTLQDSAPMSSPCTSSLCPR